MYCKTKYYTKFLFKKDKKIIMANLEYNFRTRNLLGGQAK